ncbi:MAG: 16S rRNA (uracil(1498)-N(3))-methyltransferase [Clostridia bacterium]
MHRFIIEDLCAPGVLAPLPTEEAHHAVQVLRLHEGDEVVLLDGVGGVFAATLETVEKQRVLARVGQTLPDHEPETRVTLYQGVAKGEKMDWIIQKTTELGVHAIQPVLFSRCVAQQEGKHASLKQARYRKIAEGAMKQCGRGHLPLIGQAQPLEALLPRMASHACTLVPWEEARAVGVGAMLAKVGYPRDIGLVIGPEGGIAPEEIAQMAQRSIQPVTLGARILRTETAGLAALVMILSNAGDMA